jgi:hypothetical protein
MRISTERAETVQVGSNIVAGLNHKHIVEAVNNMVNRKTNWRNPYGKPESARKTIKILEEKKKEILAPKIWWDHPKIKKSYSISSYQKKWKNTLIPDGSEFSS